MRTGSIVREQEMTMTFTEDEHKQVSLEIDITSPSDGAQLTEPANGKPITIEGTVWGNLVELEDETRDVTVIINNIVTSTKVTITPGTQKNTWITQAFATRPGSLELHAKATGKKTTPSVSPTITSEAHVSVNIVDSVPPEISIVVPTPFQRMQIAEAGPTVPLRVSAKDALGVKKIE